MMPPLGTPRLAAVGWQQFRIVPEVASERVAKDQDLIRHAAAPEEGGSAQLRADVHAIRVVLTTAIGNDDRHVIERSLELGREPFDPSSADLPESLPPVLPAPPHPLSPH